jgi:hypothetical protein
MAAHQICESARPFRFADARQGALSPGQAATSREYWSIMAGAQAGEMITVAKVNQALRTLRQGH